MKSHVQLFDAQTIDQLTWPSTPEGEHAKAMLLPMMQEGVDAFIENVHTTLFLLKIGDCILPVTVNEKENDNSYLTSNFFVIKHLEEKLAQAERFSLMSSCKRALLKGAEAFLNGMKFNKVVIVNNWLQTTNIYPKLESHHIDAITPLLKEKFPDHAIIFRSLDDERCQQIVSFLDNQRYRFFGSRNIYIYDPERKNALSSKALYHLRRDRRLIEQEGYEIFRGDSFEISSLQRFLELYGRIYLKRYTKYSPNYTIKYLQQAIQSRFFDVIGIKKEKNICGVMGCYVRNGIMTIPFFGYDPEFGVSNHLYRMLTVLAIEEAEKRNVVLSDGSGAEAPKKYRGMYCVPEYLAIYDRHLPMHRRCFWSLAEKFSKGQTPEIF